MQNKWVINVLLIIIMILVVIACVVTYMCFTNDVEIIELQGSQKLFSINNYPKIDGIGATEPLAEAFKANFTGVDIADIDIEHSKENNAFVNLINGNTDLILIEYPTEQEKKLAEDKGIKLEIVPIANDAFVFMVNKNNLVENLSLGQIQNIYSGKTKNWKDIGGNDITIKAFQRPENSRNQNKMSNDIMKGLKMIQPIKKTISQGRTEIIDVVSDYDNSESSIGFGYYYYIINMYTKDNMKLLSIDRTKPTYDNIRTGLYNLQTKYYAVIRKDEPESSNTRKLLNAMISEKGQNIVKEAGYVQNY